MRLSNDPCLVYQLRMARPEYLTAFNLDIAADLEKCRTFYLLLTYRKARIGKI